MAKTPSKTKQAKAAAKAARAKLNPKARLPRRFSARLDDPAGSVGTTTRLAPKTVTCTCC